MHRLIFLCFFCSYLFPTNTSPVIYAVWPRTGSLFGGAQVTLYGSNFAEDLFIQTNEIHFDTISCQLVEFASSRKRTKCISGHYSNYSYDSIEAVYTNWCSPTPFFYSDELRSENSVNLDIVIITNGNSFRTNHPSKTFTYLISLTPKISYFLPSSGFNGDVIEIWLERTNNWNMENMKRITIGDKVCVLKDPNTNLNYGFSSCGYWCLKVKCRVTNTIPGMFNLRVSTLDFGVAWPTTRSFQIMNDCCGFAQFEIHPNIEYVSPSQGSSLGGTIVTIKGNGFGTDIRSINVDIWGIPCNITKLIDSEIVCMTGKLTEYFILNNSADPSLRYPGGHGSNRYSFKNIGSTALNTLRAHYKYPAYPDGYAIMPWLESHTSRFEDNYGERFEAFFSPCSSGYYSFIISGDDQHELYFADSANYSDLKSIAVSNRYSLFRNFDARSHKIWLDKNGTYLLAAEFKEGGGADHLSVGTIMHETNLTYFHTQQVSIENQTISISSTFLQEIQELNIYSYGHSLNYNISFTLNVENKKTPNIQYPSFKMFQNQDCFNEKKGQDYRGNVAMTKSGIKCQIWSSNVPNGHSLDANSSGIGDHNYCRNPDNKSGGPWCYFASHEGWDFCNLDFCIKDALGYLFTAQCSGNKFNIRIDFVVLDFEIDMAYYPLFSEDFVKNSRSLSDSFCGSYSIDFQTSESKLIYFNKESERPSIEEAKYLCLAYKIPHYHPFVVSYQVQQDDESYHWYSLYSSSSQNSTVIIPQGREGVELNAIIYDNSTWIYDCFNIYASIRESGISLSSEKLHHIKNIEFLSIVSNAEIYIDVISLSYEAKKVEQLSPAIHPNNLTISNIHIESRTTNNGEYNQSSIKYFFNTTDCAGGLPMILGSSNNGSLIVNTSRLQNASLPIRGCFSVQTNTFQNSSINNLTYDINANDFLSRIKEVFLADNVKGGVAFSDNICRERKFWISFYAVPGDLEPVQVDASMLTGNDLKIKVDEVTPGGLIIAPIPGHMLRTVNLKPQINVRLNGRLASCKGQFTQNEHNLLLNSSINICDFSYSNSSQLKFIDVNPRTACVDSELVLYGEDFGYSPSDILIIIGNSYCKITSMTNVNLTCVLPHSVGGKQSIYLSKSSFGNIPSSNEQLITICLKLLNISSTRGSVEGGLNLTIEAINGFVGYPLVETNSQFKMVIEMANSTCEILSGNHTHVYCLTPPSFPQIVDIKVKIFESGVLIGNDTLSQVFTYGLNDTPIVTNISQFSGSVLGGDTVTIFLQRLHDLFIDVFLDEVKLKINSISSTSVEVITPSHAPGRVKIIVVSRSVGLAISDHSFEFRFYVCNISSSAGSLFGGQTLEIFGGGFSILQSKYKIKIGSYLCSIISLTDSVIRCITQTTALRHFIYRYFISKLFQSWSSPVVNVHPGDQVTWSWSNIILNENLSLHQTRSPSSLTPFGNEIQSGMSTSATYEHSFHSSGSFYYTAGGNTISNLSQPADCYMDGIPYQGKLSITQNFPCLSWNSQYVRDVYPGNHPLLGSHNYCRNPDNDPKGPWCFSSATNMRSYCNIQKCGFRGLIVVSEFLPKIESKVEIFLDSFQPKFYNTCNEMDFLNTTETNKYYSYFPSRTPQILKVSSNRNEILPGSVIELAGVNFGSSIDEHMVLLGNLSCQIINLDKTESLSGLVFVVPNLMRGEYMMSLHVSSLGWAFFWDNLHLITIQSVVEKPFPNCGSVFGGTQLTIHGVNFHSVDITDYQVNIGNTQCILQRIVSFNTSQDIICLTQSAIDDGYSALISLLKPISYWTFDDESNPLSDSGYLNDSTSVTLACPNLYSDDSHINSGIHTRSHHSALFYSNFMKTKHQQVYANFEVFAVELWLRYSSPKLMLMKQMASFSNCNYVDISNINGYQFLIGNLPYLHSPGGYRLVINPCNRLELWIASGKNASEVDISQCPLFTGSNCSIFCSGFRQVYSLCNNNDSTIWYIISGPMINSSSFDWLHITFGWEIHGGTLNRFYDDPSNIQNISECVYEGTSRKFCNGKFSFIINGVIEASGNTSYSPGSQVSQLFIGGIPLCPGSIMLNFTGILDELVVLPHPLTHQEAISHYNISRERQQLIRIYSNYINFFGTGVSPLVQYPNISDNYDLYGRAFKPQPNHYYIEWKVKTFADLNIFEDDILTFLWKSLASLIEINRISFDTCATSTGLIKTWASYAVQGIVNISNLSPGEHYFISDLEGHCQSGMKIKVCVLLRPPLRDRISRVLVPSDQLYFSYIQSDLVITNISSRHLIINEVMVLNINGNFSLSDNITVFIDSNIIFKNPLTSATISFLIPIIEAGKYALRVKINNFGYVPFNMSANLVNYIILEISPVINTVDPSIGSIMGGTIIYLRGLGFLSSFENVSIKGMPCNILTSNITTLVCQNLPATEDYQNVSVYLFVAINGAISNSVNFTFSTSETPEINYIFANTSLTKIVPGSNLYLLGTKITENTIVRIRGLADTFVDEYSRNVIDCPLNSYSIGEISCTVPSLPGGDYILIVFVPDSGFARFNSSITPQIRVVLSISKIEPSRIGTGGGSVVIISGSGFVPSQGYPSSSVFSDKTEIELIQVTICDILCEVTLSTETFINVIAPKIGSNITQLCHVSVRSNLIISALNNSILLDPKYNAVIHQFAPTMGGTGGGTILTIFGSGFGDVSGEVIIGISNCSISSWNDTIIICITGTHRTNRKAVVSVNIPNIGYATHTNMTYSYIDRWSSNFTWGGYNPPLHGETVYIPKSFIVLLDVSPPLLNLILIEGELIFEDVRDINLTAKYIVINGGKLQIGTPEKPFLHKAEITLHGNVNDPGIPLYGSKVLAVRQGALDIHGKPRTRTWTRLNETAYVNQKFVKIQDQVQDWHKGDQIIIAPTGKDSNETESLEIYDVTENGTTILLMEPLRYSHLGIRDIYHGGKFIDLRAEVGLLSHNVILQGSLLSPSDPRGIGSDLFGGHLMVFRPKPDPMDIRLSHLEVRFMGQAFRLGRYSIHFHLSDRMNGSYVRHCSIHHSFNRAITAHGVEDMLFEGIVAYDIQGHAFFIEDGIEFGNKFYSNLGVLVRGSSSLLNTDQLPAVFWITNPNNTFENNVAAGSRAYGFWYDLDPHPSGPSQTNSVCPNKNPFGGFKNNVAHSNAEFGLRIWETYDPHKIPCNEGSDRDTVTLYNLTSYANGIHGVEFSVVGHIKVDGFKLADNRDNGIEISETVGECSAAEIKNSLIISKTRGNSQLPQLGGIKTMRRNFLRITNVTFINFNGNNTACLRACSHCKDFQGGFQVEFQGITFLGGSERRIASFQWEHEVVFKDLDGTLTRREPGSIVLPYSSILPSDYCNLSVPEFSLNLNGSVCSPSVHMVRIAWNQVEPQITFTGKEANFTNQFGSTLIPWRRKRLTHGSGYMALLPANYCYVVSYRLDKDEQTDITFYRGSIYNLIFGDYIRISQYTHNKPNHWNVRDESKGLNNRNSTLPNSICNSMNRKHLEWYYENTTKTMTYMIKGESDTDKCTPRAFSVTREPCPVDENGIAKCQIINPTEGEYESTPRLWSNPENWPSQTVPSLGEDVTINSSWIMYLDISPPQLGKLLIFGQLIFNDTQDINLTAAIILVQGNNAHLIIGTANSPFQHRAVITLIGNKFSEEISLSRNINLGSKALGIFGNVSIFGKPNLHISAKLNETINAGSLYIHLDVESLNWSVGDYIVIAASGYNADETETNKIAAINGNTITLIEPLRYSHLYQPFLSDDNMHDSNNTDWRKPLVLAAEVALLSRNVIIQGGEDSSQPLEEYHFGCRILSGKFSSSTSVYIGHFKIDNVEIRNCGQGGFFSSRDPRYSFAIKNGGDNLRGSFISSSAIHHSYNTGIGIHLTNGIQIRNNIIYRTVDSGIRVGGTSNIIEDNIVMLVSSVLPGQPSDKHAVDFPAAYEIEGMHVLKRNIAAGSYRLGFRISGDSCSEQDTHIIEENVAHTTWAGVLITGTSNNCTALRNFISVWAWNYGIFAQTVSSLVLSRIAIVIGKIGVNVNTLGPDSIQHLLGRKSVRITDSLIIGALPNELCVEVMPPYFSQNTLQPSNNKSGIMMSYMNRKSFKIFKTWHQAQHYPVIDGDFRILNTTFVNFKDRGCRFSDFSITNNPVSPDAVTPLSIQNTKKIEVDDNSLLYFYPPNPAWIVQEDCVDMDCDGPKHALIKDLDGSFTSHSNIPTTLIPFAELRFDESKIPRVWRYNSSTEQLVDPTILAPPDFRGISRGVPLNDDYISSTKGCSFIHQWNGYKCINIDHYVLITESMDPDTEIRRLSPIALNGGDTGNGRYTDLINGPMDHGWCTSYTCLKRLSTFFTIIASRTYYTIWLSSTNPSHIRFHLLNSDDDPDNPGSVVIKIWYSDARRKDIYVDGKLISPLNQMEDEYRALGDEYIPTHSQPTGSNYFDYNKRLMHLLIKGNEPVSIRTANIVQLSFNLEVSLNSFFDPTEFLNNLVLVLNIDPTTIRIVNVVSERRQRRRRQDSSPTQVILELGPPAETIIETPQTPSIQDQMDLSSSDLAFSSIDAEANESADVIPTQPPPLAPIPTTDIDNDTTVPTAREYADEYLIQRQQYEADLLLYNEILSAYNEITNIANFLVTLVQTNNLSIVNASLVGLTVEPPTPPIPPPTPLIPPVYSNITTDNNERLLDPVDDIPTEIPLTSNSSQVIQIRVPSNLFIIQQPSSVIGHLLYVIAEVRDNNGDIVTQLGLTELWACKAILNHTYEQNSSAPYFSGETEVTFVDGRAEFTRLRVSTPAEFLRVFFITTPGNLQSELSTEFEVTDPPSTWSRTTFSFRINGDYSIAITQEFIENFSFEISKIMDVDVSRIQGLMFSNSNEIIVRAQLLDSLASDPPNVPTTIQALTLLQIAIDTNRLTIVYNNETFPAVPSSLITNLSTFTTGTLSPTSVPGTINFIMIIAIILSLAVLILFLIIAITIGIGLRLIFSHRRVYQLNSARDNSHQNIYSDIKRSTECSRNDYHIADPIEDGGLVIMNPIYTIDSIPQVHSPATEIEFDLLAASSIDQQFYLPGNTELSAK